MKSKTAGMEVNLGWECSGRLQSGAPLAWAIAAWIRRAHVSVGDNGHHVGGSNHGGINSCLVLVRRLATLHKRDAEQIIQQDLERISFHRVSIWHRAATLSRRGKCKSYNMPDLLATQMEEWSLWFWHTSTPVLLIGPDYGTVRQPQPNHVIIRLDSGKGAQTSWGPIETDIKLGSVCRLHQNQAAL